jgi:hypothetical protein
VRLATSIQLAPDLRIDHGAIARAILQGYREGLDGPTPVFLDRPSNSWIRPYVNCSDHCRRKFGDDIDKLKLKKPPRRVRRGLIRSLLPGAEPDRFCRRTAGGGSLGRPRFVVAAKWRGGRVVREAKAIVPSAWIWAHQGRGRTRRHPFLELSNGRFRAPDPFLGVHGEFLYRRLAADARKIDLDMLGARLEPRLIKAMGAELGSIHAATRGSRNSIIKDLAARPPGWLLKAAAAAAKATVEDYREWRK